MIKPPCEKVIVPTAEYIQAWRRKIVGLSNLDYSMNDLGNALVEALSVKDNVVTELPLVVKHFLDGQTGSDYNLAVEALEELYGNICRIIEKVKIREDDGYLQFFFEGWYNDDMVLLYYPH